jgi:hypothetical protein
MAKNHILLLIGFLSATGKGVAAFLLPVSLGPASGLSEVMVATKRLPFESYRRNIVLSMILHFIF